MKACALRDAVGRDDPARRLAVGKRTQLPAGGTPGGRALQEYVSFTVVRLSCVSLRGAKRRGNPLSRKRVPCSSANNGIRIATAPAGPRNDRGELRNEKRTACTAAKGLAALRLRKPSRRGQDNGL